MAFEFIQAELNKRSEAGLLRSRQCLDSSEGTLIEEAGAHYLNFSSNDYLGMRQSQDVLQSWVEGMSLYGAGSGASPLVTGYTKAHRELEEYLAAELGRDAVLLFNSGFAANQAICQALLNKQCHVVADKLIHASFIDGALASEARLHRFRHNDIAHLTSVLDELSGDILLATEGVFSMDGDLGLISEILKTTSPHQTMLMLDDAHGFGVLGESGMGSVEEFSLNQQQLPVLMGTFGKAVGTAGAFVAGSQELIDYLINFSRHYIYSTAMPPAQAVATLTSIQLLRDGKRQKVLKHNIATFRSLAQENGIPLMSSESPIQPVPIGEPNRAVRLSEKLKSLGIWVNAIRTPTVPKGTDRLRITITAEHTATEILALVDALSLSLSTLSER